MKVSVKNVVKLPLLKPWKWRIFPTLGITLTMALPQQQVYPFDIPSISNLHPGIPAHVVHTLHLDENITNGDPIDILNTKRAQGVASSLAHLQG